MVIVFLSMPIQTERKFPFNLPCFFYFKYKCISTKVNSVKGQSHLHDRRDLTFQKQSHSNDFCDCGDSAGILREFVYGPKVRLDQVTLSGPDLQIELVTASLAFAIVNCTIRWSNKRKGGAHLMRQCEKAREDASRRT